MRNVLFRCGLALAAALPGLSLADVTQASAHGFLITSRADIDAAPAAVFEALGRIGEWWNPEHTYSGRSANLALELKAGGCFCERLEGGGVEHARVLLVLPGRSVRLDGALGPLQGEAVNAIWEFTVKRDDGRTQLAMTYRVRGTEAAFEKLAVPVDRVMSEQFSRLVAYLAKK